MEVNGTKKNDKSMEMWFEFQVDWVQAAIF